MRHIVATFANKDSQKDLEVFLFSLSLWHTTDLKVYIFTDTLVTDVLESDVIQTNKYNFPIITKNVLDKYSSLTRKQMENIRGEQFATKWGDLMGEKMNLLDWIFEVEPIAAKVGIYLLDADICFFGPLPQVSATTQLALSPHYINNRSTTIFGKYNGGFIFTRSPQLSHAWRNATIFRSRYFEQAALEELAEDFDAYEFPLQVNYGWWRMFQADVGVEEQQRAFGGGSGGRADALLVNGEVLQSVHTHWTGSGVDPVCCAFNKFILEKCQGLATPLEKLVEYLQKVSAIT
jgi:hypothetical protein